MNYCSIKKFDIANGTGVRVSLFVSGCRHRCEGCFNPESWSFSAGKPFDEAARSELFSALAFERISGLTLLGGEPLEPENQYELLPFLKEVKRRFPEKNIWCYTGCVLERDLLSPSAYRCEVTDRLLSCIDVLVDGEFILSQKNISLTFRGSENQRILRRCGSSWKLADDIM